MPQFTPLDVYKAYPGTEFLLIRKPKANETWDHWMEYLEEQDSANSVGDTLFMFVMRELYDGGEAVDIDTACNRLNRGINDLYSVKAALDTLDPQSAEL